MGKSSTPVAKPGAVAYEAKGYTSMADLIANSNAYTEKKKDAGYAEMAVNGRGPIRDNTGMRDPVADPNAPRVDAPARLTPEQEQAAKDRAGPLQLDAAWLAKDKATTLEGQALAKQKNTEKDTATMASAFRKLMDKRVFDLGRVRNRSTEYQAPQLGGDMMGTRKRLLGR